MLKHTYLELTNCTAEQIIHFLNDELITLVIINHGNYYGLLSLKLYLYNGNTFHYFTQLEAGERTNGNEAAREKKGVRDKIPRGWNEHEFPRAIVRCTCTLHG